MLFISRVSDVFIRIKTKKERKKIERKAYLKPL